MNEVEQARAALRKMDETLAPRKSALKELVAAIAEDVQERMKQGYTIPQIVAQLNEVRDPEDKINEGTFRGYLQDVRKELGLEPVRKMKAKSPAHTKKTRKKPTVETEPDVRKVAHHEQKRDQPMNEINKTTAGDFRNQEREP